MNIISRGDTEKQKIKRNIKYLYNIAGKLNLKYPHIRVFHYIEGMCSLVVKHNVSVRKIYLDSEIDLLEEILGRKDFSKLTNDKNVMNLYNCIIRTNKSIYRVRSKRKAGSEDNEN